MKVTVHVLPRSQTLHKAHIAGQGYIWLAHREPKSSGWAIAQRSKQLWEDMLHPSDSASSEQKTRLGSKADIEWQVLAQLPNLDAVSGPFISRQ